MGQILRDKFHNKDPIFIDFTQIPADT